MGLEARDNGQWLQNFRRKKQTFMELCKEFAPPEHSILEPIPVQKCVTIDLWKLAAPDRSWGVSN